MAAVQMYYQESKEEVRTETRSSGPEPSVKNNELDSLLSGLNQTRCSSIKDRAAMNNTSRPTVASLLSELNSVSNSHETTKQTRNSQQDNTEHVSTSTATRDLDNIMAQFYDLAETKPVIPPAPSSPGPTSKKYSSFESSITTTNINNVPTAIINVDNATLKPTLNKNETYAKPEKPKTPTPPPKEPTPVANELDFMLGTLSNHMTEQGVTTTQKGSCCACDKPIVGQVITALGKTWHPEHFTCAHCNHELGSNNFFEREGRPYCEACYHELFSPRCGYCHGPILDKCVTALKKNWHPEHFFCYQCGNAFGEEGFHEKDGKAYCREDYYSMFAPKCGGCNAPIMENYISALNAQWHPDCFVCRDCRQPFSGGSFFDHEGMPYCETHYHEKRGSLCYGCHKPITGRCITAMFRKYHPEHFTCSYCLRQLNKGTFKEQNDKPFCHPCFEKLFG